MKRGELWTVSAGPHYAGKARPVLIVQEDRFDATDSVTVCLITTSASVSPLFRITVNPTTANGLTSVSAIMIDKTTTIQRSKLGKRLGHLSGKDLIQVNRSIALFFGLSASSRGAKT